MTIVDDVFIYSPWLVVPWFNEWLLSLLSVLSSNDAAMIEVTVTSAVNVIDVTSDKVDLTQLNVGGDEGKTNKV